jgi:hypothetical protein
MAVLTRVVAKKGNNGRITKRDMLIEELANVLEEHFEANAKFTKEGIVLTFKNEKNEEKDFVFKIVEKKDRIKEGDFLQ